MITLEVLDISDAPVDWNVITVFSYVELVDAVDIVTFDVLAVSDPLVDIEDVPNFDVLVVSDAIVDWCVITVFSFVELEVDGSIFVFTVVCFGVLEVSDPEVVDRTDPEF